SFYNMTEFRGRQEWWHGGSCMIAEDIPGGRRYRCNDFELDEDFDDLVFSVVRSSGAEPGAAPDRGGMTAFGTQRLIGRSGRGACGWGGEGGAWATGLRFSTPFAATSGRGCTTPKRSPSSWPSRGVCWGRAVRPGSGQRSSGSSPRSGRRRRN